MMSTEYRIKYLAIAIVRPYYVHSVGLRPMPTEDVSTVPAAGDCCSTASKLDDGYEHPFGLLWLSSGLLDTSTDFRPASNHDLSPALFRRACALAAEHSQLSIRLADSFDPKVAKRVGELSTIAQAVKDFEKAKEVGLHVPICRGMGFRCLLRMLI